LLPPKKNSSGAVLHKTPEVNKNGKLNKNMVYASGFHKLLQPNDLAKLPKTITSPKEHDLYNHTFNMAAETDPRLPNRSTSKSDNNMVPILQFQGMVQDSPAEMHSIDYKTLVSTQHMFDHDFGSNPEATTEIDFQLQGTDFAQNKKEIRNINKRVPVET